MWHHLDMPRRTMTAAPSQDSEERAAVGGVVPFHLYVLGFVDFRAFGPLPPFLERLGVAPHLDHVDPFGVHRVGGDGDVDASVEVASTCDEITEGGDEGVAPLGVHQLMAGNDDHACSPVSTRKVIGHGFTASHSHQAFT
jgi:hypothetical protein